MKRIAASLVAASVCLAAGPVSAEWLYEGQPSAFGGDGEYIAFTTNFTFTLGMRCRGLGFHVVYVTPEQISSSEEENLRRLSWRLLLRVDDHEVVERPTRLDTFNGLIRLESSVDELFFRQVRDAKRRISVAVKLRDEIFHEQSFSAKGSTASMNKMMHDCGVWR